MATAQAPTTQTVSGAGGSGGGGLKPLPTRLFLGADGNRTIASAADAARVCPVPGGHEVRVFHPEGGYILVAATSAGPNGAEAAKACANDLNGAIAAWARFTSESSADRAVIRAARRAARAAASQ